MCGYFCIEFIGFMFAGETLTDFINTFTPNNFTKNDDIILNYFMIFVEKSLSTPYTQIWVIKYILG